MTVAVVQSPPQGFAQPGFATEGTTLQMPLGGPWTVEKSFAYCVENAKRAPQSTPLAYWLLGTDMRPPIATVYTFARTLYDFAAEPEYEGQREALLHACEDALIKAYRGEASHPLFIALRETAERFHLPITPFQDLLTGARMTMSMRRFTSFQALLTYCEKAANPFGRILLALARDGEADHIRAADDISTALMLNYFWTHLDQDFSHGRLYLPQEDLLRFGVTESDLKQRRLTKSFRALMDFEVSRTRMLLMRGRPLCGHLPKSTRNVVQMIWFGVHVALDNLVSDGFDVFNRAHDLRPVDWVKASTRMALWRAKDFTQW